MGKETTSYGVKIVGSTKILRDTIDVFRKALAFVIPIVDNHYNELQDLQNVKERKTFIEKLIHTTKQNTAVYPFDKRFYGMPAYFRRNVIAKALGIVSSYRSNLENWENEDPKTRGRKPQLQLHHKAYPTFYMDGAYKEPFYPKAKIKIFHKNSWHWVGLDLRKSDVDYLNRHKGHLDESAPTLARRGRGYELRFSYKEEFELPDETNAIVAVDLGLNTDATLVAMTPDGTILDREFIKFNYEKDQIKRSSNRIKRNQRKGSRGKGSNKALWRRLKNMSHHIADELAGMIVDYAQRHGAKVIVFEYLDFKGVKKRRNALLQYWCYARLFKVASSKAHLNGIRVSRINPKNTSRLAFDGSGKVKRGREISDNTSYSLVEFTSGKMYNADLNAAYNIGARYLIRAHLKPLTKRKRSLVLAKVPALNVRTTCVYADLLELVRILNPGHYLTIG